MAYIFTLVFHRRTLGIVYILALGFTPSGAQSWPVCQGGEPPAWFCNQACVVCDLNGYSNTTIQVQPGGAPPGYCTQVVHNIGWIGFVAGSTSLSLSVDVGPCTQGTSIEMGIYEGMNCPNSQLVSNCNTAMFQNNTYTFDTDAPLQPGCVYFLVFDNNGPASCPFTVTVTSGSATAPVPEDPGVPEGPTAVCPGATVTYSIPQAFGVCSYTWTAPPGSTINGLPSPVTIQGNAGTSVEVTFGAQSGQVCVQGGNTCYPDNQPSCLPVTVAPVPPTVLETLYICNGTYIEWIDGNLYNATQLLSTTYASWLGCDSVVRQQLVVQPPITTNLGTQTLCPGSCFEVGDLEYCDPGFYQIALPSYQGCDSTVIFSLLQVPITASIAAADTLDCSFSTILLDGSGSTPGVDYSWYNAQQELLGTGITQSVGDTGAYILVVTRNSGGLICQDTALVFVAANLLTPEAVAAGDTIDCSGNPVQLNGESLTANALFSWAGPGIDSMNSMLEDPFVDQVGAYVLTVIDPANGCTATDTAFVTANADAPGLQVAGIDTLTCITIELHLTAQTDSSGIAIAWTGPGGFQSDSSAVLVTQSGQYTVTATAPNGCETVLSFHIAQDTVPPVLTVSGDSLNCDHPTGMIAGWSSGSSAQYQWTGPGGFQSTSDTAMVNLPGTYLLQVTESNGCTSLAEAVVSADFESPEVQAIQIGTLTCTDTVVMLVANAVMAGTQFIWTGPGGLMFSGDTLPVGQPGVYQVEGLGLNGCRDTFEITTGADTLVPQFQAQGGILGCLQDSVILSVQSLSPGAVFSWNGPGGFSSDAAMVAVYAPGNYTLTVTGGNGCVGDTLVLVSADVTPPLLSATATDVITCLSPTSTLMADSGTPGVVFDWSGPGGFSATGSQATANTSGMYTVVATGINGCTSSAVVTVQEDLTIPDVFAAGDTLDCLSGGITITGSSNTAGVVYSWTGPGNFTSTLASPVVNASGLYTLTVTGPNGCTATATATVYADDGAPDLLALGGPPITCGDTLSEVTATSSTPGTVFFWSGPNNFTAGSASAIVGSSGLFTVVATAPNGCTAVQTVLVESDIAPPEATAIGDTITCLHPTATLNGSSPNLNVSYDWAGPGNFMASGANVSVSTPGIYVLTVTGSNGCTVTAQAEVAADVSAPQVAAAADGLLTCVNTQVGIAANPAMPDLAFSWTGPGGFTGSGPAVGVGQPGNYQVIATGLNGCADTAQVQVLQDIAPPDALAVGDTIDCRDPLVTLNGSSATLGVSYQWSGPGNFASDVQMPVVSVPGTYSLTVTAQNGCTGTAIATVFPDVAVPVVSASGGVIDCNEPQVVLMAASAAQGLTFSWSGPGGFQQTGNMVPTQLPGPYTVVATAPNGCTGVAMATVVADTAAPQVQARATDLSCRDTFAILSATVSPPTAALVWTGPQSGLPALSDITVHVPGLYTVRATSSNGCTAETQVAVESPYSGWSIDLGQDTTVHEGTWITLYLQTDLEAMQVADIRWEPTYGCYDCNRQVFRADTNSILRVWVEDLNGCVQEDFIRINVLPRGRIYVPNIFSPDENGLNDRFRVFAGPGVTRVKTFMVYDRWGAQVFLANDYYPDEATGVWDGTFRGQALQPAVFVWVAEVLLDNGETVRYTGDVTLRR